jgi:hypothetical protein
MLFNIGGVGPGDLHCWVVTSILYDNPIKLKRAVLHPLRSGYPMVSEAGTNCLHSAAEVLVAVGIKTARKGRFGRKVMVG